jgi:ABC-type multidrug transport system fused ATPase/permease subunit
MAIWISLKSYSDIFLIQWMKTDPHTNWSNYYLYMGLAVGSVLFIYIRTYLLIVGSLYFAKNLHATIVYLLVKAPINLFHDVTPKGQILNRLSKDLTSLDVSTTYTYNRYMTFAFQFIGAVAVCSYYSIWSLLAIPFLVVVDILATRFYIKGSRDLSRLDGITRSPTINLLAETLTGSITIRAYNFSNEFIKKFSLRLDNNHKVKQFVSGVTNWYGLHLDIFSFIFLLCFICSTIFMGDGFDTAELGIMLSYIINLQDNLSKLLNFGCTFENSMVSLERCLVYTKIKTEAPGELPGDAEIQNWPSKGEVEFKNYSVKYRPDTEIVLKNLSFRITGGEKIGVIGRTGSGKSTICLSLFRILEPLTGTIFIDGVDICQLGLKKLRSALTIIPQDPNLFAGTLRYNIDPLNLYTEQEIIEVMKMIDLFYMVENSKQGLKQKVLLFIFICIDC